MSLPRALLSNFGEKRCLTHIGKEGPPRCLLAVEASDGLKEREFIHFFPGQRVLNRTVELPIARWKEYAEALFGSSNDRKLRALRWLRKAFTEDDYLDRFQAVWTGLETLNPLLADKLGVPRSVEIEEECEGCGHKTKRKIPGMQGAKELLIGMDEEETYNSARRARNGLIHGYKALAGVTTDALSHLPALGRSLAEGIKAVTAAEVPTDPRIFHLLAAPRVASVVFLEGSMQLADLNEHIATSGAPLFEIKISQASKPGEDGGTLISGRATVDAPVDLTVRGWGVSGPGQIEKLTAELVPKAGLD